MTHLRFGPYVLELPGSEITRAKTAAPNAWHPDYRTIRLHAPIQGLRVHTDGKPLHNRPAANRVGAWVAIDDVVMTASEFANSRALPRREQSTNALAFTHVADVTLPAGCIVNIGKAAPLFWYGGGGYQAEYVAGPRFRFRQLAVDVWSDRWGHA